jgi:hypothetical protein
MAWNAVGRKWWPGYRSRRPRFGPEDQRSNEITILQADELETEFATVLANVL